jgi:ABC-2 type transport system ATP-binding protein
MSESVISARGLTKVFPNGLVALKDLNLAVERGAVYGLIGRNASGKTTTLRLVLGLLRPNEGEARVLGWNLQQAPRRVRELVAYVSQTERLPGAITLGELCRSLKHVNQRWDSDYARGLARRWDLPWGRPLGALSHGEQRRAGLLLAFAGRPQVLVLDEPAGGFDPVARRELAEQLLEALTQQDGCTVLLSTQLVGDLERVADHVGVLDHGRLAFSARLDTLLNEIKRVQVIFEEEAVPRGFAIPGALQTKGQGAVLQAIVRWSNGHELEALRESANARVQVFPIGLEEMFIELFGRSDRGESDQVPADPPGYAFR